MSRISLIGALGALGAGNGACKSIAPRTVAAGLQRGFTSTAQRNAHITKFTRTSSPALDELLDTIRTKIILPSYLPSDQRKKIFSPKFAQKLQSDPITMEIDGEVLKFRHINPMDGSMPETSGSVVRAISQFETPEDFENFIPLLEGIANTGNKISNSVWCKIIRILGNKGYIMSIINSALRVKDTNFRLNDHEKVTGILHHVQMKAIDAKLAKTETNQALRWAEMVVDMLQDEPHQLPKLPNKPEPAPEQLPLDRDPMILLAPLHLAALSVEYQPPDSEVMDRLVGYAEDVVRAWPEGKELRYVQHEWLYQKWNPLSYLTVDNKYLGIAAPLLHGLEKAVKVIKHPVAEKLELRRAILAKEVSNARVAAAQKMRERQGEAGNNERVFPEGEAIYRRVFPDAAPVEVST